MAPSTSAHGALALLVALGASPAAAQKCMGLGFKNPAYALTTPASNLAGFMPVAEPWRSLTCCSSQYTYDLQTYGVEYLYSNYSFHHCAAKEGKPRISAKCEQFLMWEEAFYSCDPYIGLLDKDGDNITDRLPICRSFADEWYAACKNDYSCVRDWINDWDFSNPNNITCPADSTCKTFGEWYANGTDMMNSMWGTAFSVATDQTACINMWWWGQNNQNKFLAGGGGSAAVSTVASVASMATVAVGALATLFGFGGA